MVRLIKPLQHIPVPDKSESRFGNPKASFTGVGPTVATETYHIHQGTSDTPLFA